MTFPQPVREKEKLKYLENIDKSELDPEFIETSDQFIAYISTHLKCKKIEGKNVTGSGEHYAYFEITLIHTCLEKHTYTDT